MVECESAPNGQEFLNILIAHNSKSIPDIGLKFYTCSFYGWTCTHEFFQWILKGWPGKIFKIWMIWHGMTPLQFSKETNIDGLLIENQSYSFKRSRRKSFKQIEWGSVISWVESSCSSIKLIQSNLGRVDLQLLY